MELFSYLAIPLLLTVFIEAFVLLLLKEQNWRIYLLSVGMNCITNISLNCFGYFVEIPNSLVYGFIILILEAVVWILEGIGYYLVTRNKKQAIQYTLLCNISSFMFGILFQALLNTIG